MKANISCIACFLTGHFSDIEYFISSGNICRWVTDKKYTSLKQVWTFKTCHYKIRCISRALPCPVVSSSSISDQFWTIQDSTFHLSHNCSAADFRSEKWGHNLVVTYIVWFKINILLITQYCMKKLIDWKWVNWGDR